MDFEAGPLRRRADDRPFAVSGAAAVPPALVAGAGARGFVSLVELFGRLDEARVALAAFVEGFGSRVPDCREAAALLLAGEQAGRLAERMQLAVTLAADRAVVADVGKPASGSGKSQFRDTVDFMVSALHIRRGEAFARLNAARALLPGTALCGQELAPAFPLLSEAVASGEVPVGTAMIAVRSLQKLKPVVAQRPDGGAGELEKLEGLFAGTARTQPPDIVQASVQRAEGYLDQDGIEPTEALKRELQGAYYRGRKAGLHQWLLSLDNEQNEVFRTTMLTQTNPRTRPSSPPPAPAGATAPDPEPAGPPAAATAAPGIDAGDAGTPGATGTPGGLGGFGLGAPSAVGDPVAGGGPGTEAGPGLRKPAWVPGPDGAPDGLPPVPQDNRSRPQKCLDGVMDAIRLALAGGRLPATGGMKPQVIVTIDYQTLLGQVADAATRTSASTLQGPFSPATIRRMACDADIIPAVLGGNGEVLDLGRTQRLFSTEQRKALIARDGGCTGPACTIPADMCEAHHIIPWSHGGDTSIANAALTCRRHHVLIHDSDWKIDMAGGIPYWIPPPYIDPRQPRQRNTYFHPTTHETLF